MSGVLLHADQRASPPSPEACRRSHTHYGWGKTKLEFLPGSCFESVMFFTNSPASRVPDSLPVAPRQRHAKLLELAIQVGALQSGLFRQTGDVAVFELQVIFEVQALEGFTCFA